MACKGADHARGERGKDRDLAWASAKSRPFLLKKFFLRMRKLPPHKVPSKRRHTHHIHIHQPNSFLRRGGQLCVYTYLVDWIRMFSIYEIGRDLTLNHEFDYVHQQSDLFVIRKREKRREEKRRKERERIESSFSSRSRPPSSVDHLQSIFFAFLEIFNINLYINSSTYFLTNILTFFFFFLNNPLTYSLLSRYLASNISIIALLSA